MTNSLGTTEVQLPAAGSRQQRQWVGGTKPFTSCDQVLVACNTVFGIAYVESTFDAADANAKLGEALREVPTPSSADTWNLVARVMARRLCVTFPARPLIFHAHPFEFVRNLARHGCLAHQNGAFIGLRGLDSASAASTNAELGYGSGVLGNRSRGVGGVGGGGVGRIGVQRRMHPHAVVRTVPRGVVQSYIKALRLRASALERDLNATTGDYVPGFGVW